MCVCVCVCVETGVEFQEDLFPRRGELDKKEHWLT